jgi:hypothetical protein
MKYALKPKSRYLDVNGSNKIVFFDDEKQLIQFFHNKMKQDLTSPVLKSEKYDWRTTNKPNDISVSDALGIYSLLVSSNTDLKFLSFSGRVTKYLYENIGGKNKWVHWKVVSRIRSLPCNWTLYHFHNAEEGKVLRNISWAAFFHMAKKQKLLEGVDISYRIPDQK